MNTLKKINRTDFNSVRGILKFYKDEEVVNLYSRNMDEFDRLIVEGGLRIKAIHFHLDLDLMLIVLNNKKTFLRAISGFKRLRAAKESQLNNYIMNGEGIAVHWPELDEDLSLRGLLMHELARIKKPEAV